MKKKYYFFIEINSIEIRLAIESHVNSFIFFYLFIYKKTTIFRGLHFEY